jgi:hypothetical protein
MRRVLRHISYKEIPGVTAPWFLELNSQVDSTGTSVSKKTAKAAMMVPRIIMSRAKVPIASREPVARRLRTMPDTDRATCNSTVPGLVLAKSCRGAGRLDL